LPVREVLRLGNPTLREVAEPVEDPGSPEVTALVADLGDTLAPAGFQEWNIPFRFRAYSFSGVGAERLELARA
jgi:peptide deformylase